MRIFKLLMIAALVVWVGDAVAHVPDYMRNRPSNTKKVQYRDVCANSESQIDQEINNVRARLLGGGDCWWDFNEGRYIVPKVDPSTGQREVSSIFAGSVWLGGVDPANNLKLACQDYRNDGRNDFWPGPLTSLGQTEQSTCDNWDRHFRVTGDEIRRHLRNIAEGNLNENDIPRGVKGWPAQDNPYFDLVWGFELPEDDAQGLAGFFDADGDGIYDPLKGDYPSIEIRGCPLDRYPDEMIFWIYNDHGGGQPHARTGGKAIQMEVQVQAFAYVTNDELNDMTFQRYKLINRAVERIDSTFFAMWIDADLGCSIDDYVGCDTAKALMYIYNQDNQDGQPGCNCDGGVATYCERVPILGVDYFRGPLKPQGDSLVELGMSSFTYYNRTGAGPWPAGMQDPSAPTEYYNYITGSWRDGSPFTYGGSGYQTGGQRIRYAFTEPPNDPNGWSMCTANLAIGDRRTIQASGPFSLRPGAVNELIIGIPWVPDIEYPCPDLEALFRADKLAQGLFDNCFRRLEGPDAPDVDWVELNREVVAVLSNDPLFNNFNERYHQPDFLAPDSIVNSPDSAIRASAEYRFEGYLIYQLQNPNVSASDYTDPEKARIVYQVDIKNGVSKVYNWEATKDPATDDDIYFPVLMVDGQDAGIRHTFSIKEDKFALGNDKRLINHKKYYFSVVAYAFNQWGVFEPLTQPVRGQQNPYLAGSRNIQIYTVIPRPVVDRALQSSYGDGVEITRLQGQGAGGNFLDLNQETRDRVLSAGFDSTLTYQQGKGPLNVTIFNPFEVKDGEYELSLVDDNVGDLLLDADAHWELRNLTTGETVASERTIAEINEQVVAQFGFSVLVSQTGNAGDLSDETNGAIGAEVEYGSGQPWLTGWPDDPNAAALTPLNYIKTAKLEEDAIYDPNQSLSTMGDGWFVPYPLCDWRVTPNQDPDPNRLLTPAWTERINLNKRAIFEESESKRRGLLAAMPNVDIILTSDRSKWSRCVVIETASLYYTSTSYPKDPSLQPQSPAPNKLRLSFDTRFSPSVDVNGQPDNSGTTGMGWFPGYAVDVETGRRLNIFFGENSCYHSGIDPNWTGRDMIWNPTDEIVRETRDNSLPFDYYDLILGGQHWVYVTNTTYDECAFLRQKLTPELNGATANTAKLEAVRSIAWAGMLQLAQNAQLKSLADGLVPTETRFKIRVDNAYQPWYNVNSPAPAIKDRFTAHPKYRFKIQGREATGLTAVQLNNSLDSIKAVPNPYLGYSQYETSQFTNTVKITNLPGQCDVTIYSLDGKFIRQYERNETYAPYQQITPALEWDMKNNKGIPVASGIYLIYVKAYENKGTPDERVTGERTIKWFGVARQFDPSGL